MPTVPTPSSAVPDALLRTPGEALRDYVIAELDSALAGLGWRGGRLHAGVHQARKALRRARATLALGGEALGPGAALVARELRKVNRGLSTLRDAQALVEMLTRLIAEPWTPELLRLLRRARRVGMLQRAEIARAALVDDPQLRARRDLLLALRGAMLALPWQRPTSPTLQAALARGVECIGQVQARAVRKDRDDDWHRWRRRERRLSQQHRALKAADIAHAIPLTKADKRIALKLGAAQDLSLLGEHCGRDSPFAKPDRLLLKQFVDAELAKQRQAIVASQLDKT